MAHRSRIAPIRVGAKTNDSPTPSGGDVLKPVRGLDEHPLTAGSVTTS